MASKRPKRIPKRLPNGPQEARRDFESASTRRPQEERPKMAQDGLRKRVPHGLQEAEPKPQEAPKRPPRGPKRLRDCLHERGRLTRGERPIAGSKEPFVTLRGPRMLLFGERCRQIDDSRSKIEEIKHRGEQEEERDPAAVSSRSGEQQQQQQQQSSSSSSSTR